MTISIVPKKKDQLRFYVSYRKLNGVVENNLHSVSGKEKCLYTVTEAALLSNVDTTSGFWQDEVEETRPDKLLLGSITDYTGK